MTVALLDWSLYVDCPHCEESVDLVETDCDNDYSIANKVFSNKWDEVKGQTVTCPNCREQFELSGMEY